MIFPGFPGVLSFFQVFQVEREPWIYLLTNYVCGRAVKIKMDPISWNNQLKDVPKLHVWASMHNRLWYLHAHQNDKLIN